MNSNRQSLNTSPKPITFTASNEVSLIDIAYLLVRNKKLILTVIAITVCIGLIYSINAKRIYRVTTDLLPPSMSDIQSLNIISNKNNAEKIKTTDVFEFYLSNLNSRKLRLAFFNEHKILEEFLTTKNQLLSDKEKNEFFEDFTKNLRVAVDEKSKKVTVTLKYIYSSKLGIWLDSFIEHISQETINQLLNNLQGDINSKIVNIKAEIASKRSIYKQRREDELGRLKEAFLIAKKLGIRNHLFVPNVDTKSKIEMSEELSRLNNSASSKNKLLNELNSLSNRLSNKNNLSIYMKGTKVLQAEIEALLNRKSDDIYISGIRDLQEKLVQLEGIKTERSSIKVVNVDKKAIENSTDVSMNKIIIITLSLFMGGILGVFSVLIVEAYKHFSNELKNKYEYS